MSKPQDTIENLLSEITHNVFLLNVLQMEPGSFEDRKDEKVYRGHPSISMTVKETLHLIHSWSDGLISHLKKLPKET